MYSGGVVPSSGPSATAAARSDTCSPTGRSSSAACVALLATNLTALGIPYYLQPRGPGAERSRGSPTCRRDRRCCWSCSRLATATDAHRLACVDLQRGACGRVRPAQRSVQHLLTLSPGYFRDHPTGDVMSRLTNDVQTVRAMWGAGLVHLANATTAFATVLTYMIWIDWKVALLVILPYPLIFLVGQALSKRIYLAQRDVQAELGALSGRIQEDLGAIHVIKTYGLEDVRRTGLPRGQQAAARQEHDGGGRTHPARPDPQHARAARDRAAHPRRRPRGDRSRHGRRQLHGVHHAARAARVADVDARFHARADAARPRELGAARRARGNEDRPARGHGRRARAVERAGARRRQGPDDRRSAAASCSTT